MLPFRREPVGNVDWRASIPGLRYDERGAAISQIRDHGAYCAPGKQGLLRHGERLLQTRLPSTGESELGQSIAGI
jgi:hypothetical protein